MSGVLAIDFGGTRTRAAWYDPDLTQRHRAEVLTRTDESQQAVLDRIIGVASDVIPVEERPDVIGMAAPGPLDTETGVILHAETLPGWQNVPIAQIVSVAFNGVPVFIQNDANLAVVAEANSGEGRGMNPILYLTLSTGIGGGAFVDGKLFTGANGLAIEPGHQVFSLPDGSVKKLEELASGTALGTRTAAYLQQFPDTKTSLPKNTSLTGKAVGEAALNGDPFAIERVREAAGWLGLGLVNLLHLYNPQMIVLGGSMTRLGDLLLDPVRDTVQQHVLSERFLHPNLIQLAALGEDVCLIGAAYYAQSQWRQRNPTLCQ
jgi:glucokinase